jgi:hypothetical protein
MSDLPGTVPTTRWSGSWRLGIVRASRAHARIGGGTFVASCNACRLPRRSGERIVAVRARVHEPRIRRFVYCLNSHGHAMAHRSGSWRSGAVPLLVRARTTVSKLFDIVMSVRPGDRPRETVDLSSEASRCSGEHKPRDVPLGWPFHAPWWPWKRF